MTAANTYPVGCRIDAEGAGSLASGLARAFAVGADLGPRGSQIRSLGTSLETVAAALRAEIAAANASLGDLGAETGEFAALGLDRLLTEIERLAVLARAHADPKDAGVPGADARAAS